MDKSENCKQTPCSPPPTPPPKKNETHGLDSMDLKIFILEKTGTATRQLTKSRDCLQNYLCDFHVCNLYKIRLIP